MAEHLYLRLSENNSEDGELALQLEWMLLDEHSGIARFCGENNAEEFINLLVDLEWDGLTYVMLPGEEVLLTQANIPSKQTRQILQALPFMVEENLAVDIDECHFSIGDRDENGLLNVAVILQERMDYWLEALKALGLKPDVLTVDLLSVPRAKGCSIMADGNRVLIRTGDSQGLAIESSLTASTVNLLADKDHLSFLLHDSQRDATTLTVSQINAEQESGITLVDLANLPFETLCRNFNSQSINLLQGQFKTKKERSSGGNTWRSVFILAASAFALHIALLIGQGIFLDVKAKQAEADALNLYTTIFPKDRNVRDIKRRWNSHLGATGDVDGGFLDLFSDSLKQLPGSKLILNSLNFNEGRGSLVLQLEAPRSELLIQYSEALSQLGLNAEIGTINQGEDTVKGSIKVRMTGGL
ncbi:MAG: type II secretion system protein GspL [Pseudomonadales bacterium]|nr:type II secretion system protein GspL [Pseudomonadales bacterium]